MLVWQGWGAYITFNSDTATYYNCRPTTRRPVRWYANIRKVAGFANTKPITQCNAEFVNIGRQVFILVTKFIPAGSEIFVFYPLLSKYLK